MSVICYMSVICLVLGGVVRVRLYVMYAHLCNHILRQSGGGTWDTSLYTIGGGFWESGCRCLTNKRSVRRGSGAPSTECPISWWCLFRSDDVLDWSTLSLSDNKTNT
jgi:hypothetical protein